MLSGNPNFVGTVTTSLRLLSTGIEELNGTIPTLDNRTAKFEAKTTQVAVDVASLTDVIKLVLANSSFRASFTLRVDHLSLQLRIFIYVDSTSFNKDVLGRIVLGEFSFILLFKYRFLSIYFRHNYVVVSFEALYKLFQVCVICISKSEKSPLCSF